MYLDEPTANLDVRSAGIVHDILRERAAEGCTVLMTTHDMREVEEVCSRVAILCDGKVVATGAPRELSREAHTADFRDAFLEMTGREPE